MGKGNGNGNGNGNKNKKKKVQFFPCKTAILREEHVVGGNPAKQRIWDGELDLTSVVGKEQRTVVTMIFDFPANVILVRT